MIITDNDIGGRFKNEFFPTNIIELTSDQTVRKVILTDLLKSISHNYTFKTDFSEEAFVRVDSVASKGLGDGYEYADGFDIGFDITTFK